jgi:uncharacterized protein (DUF58 family)
MRGNRWLKWVAATGFVFALGMVAVPAAQALTVNAFVVKQSCVNGDVVAVTLSATVQPNVSVKYRWDFTNNGTFDTAASTNPTVTHRYPDERRVTARVVAIRPDGTKAFDTVTFTTKRCGGGGGGGGTDG